ASGHARDTSWAGAYSRRDLESRLDLEEALVVVERHLVGLVVQLDSFDDLHAHLPEQLLQRDDRARLVARAGGLQRDAVVPPDGHAVAHGAEAHAHGP